MNLKRTIIILLLFFANTKNTSGQNITRYNTFGYGVNEGLLQSTIGDIAVDQNNFCWLSFPNGIQKFDGKNFATIPVQPGLPDDKLTSFFKCSNGDLLVAHSQGISKYVVEQNGFKQVYLNPPALKRAVHFIGEDEGIIYFLSTPGTIVGVDKLTYNIVKETKTSLPDYSGNLSNRPSFSSNIINHHIVLQFNSRLYLWNLKKGMLTAQSDSIPLLSHYFLLMKADTEVLYYDYKNNQSLQLYNFTTHSTKALPVKGKDDEVISRCLVYNWKGKMLLSFSNHLYETDTTLQVLKSELVNFQNQSIIGRSGITQIVEDNFGNLYLQTVTEGIKKIIRNNYPVKYYGSEKKDHNFILTILPDKTNNRILAGTSGNGLLVYDTLQRLVKHIKTLPGRTVPFSANVIFKKNNGDYLLFIGGEKKLWHLRSDLSGFVHSPLVGFGTASALGIGYFGNPLFQNTSEAVAQSEGRIYKASLVSNIALEYEITKSYTMSGLHYKDVIITHANDELIYLDTATLQEIKRIPFKNTGYVRCFVKDKDEHIYLGSNKGIFKINFNGAILKHLTKETGLPDECIYAMEFDNEGFLWCSSNKGIFKINGDNSILQLKKEDGLQENEFNTNAVAKAADGEFFFGGVNGISSFYPSAIKSVSEKPTLLITKIKVNNRFALQDTGAWQIKKLDLSYNQNSLSFDFLAMGPDNPDKYIYQYKMVGIDEDWIQNNDLQTVRYFLQPGSYKLQLYASRSFNKDAEPLLQIEIVIHQPFWKTWWFVALLSLLLIGGLGFISDWYNKSRYNKKLQLLEAENQLKQERERISRDLHDSLGAYANAVLYNTEMLQAEANSEKRNELMKDLRFASKDIITSLRETIWALNKERYTASECLLRIRNFVQSLSRYYSNIHFTVEGDAPDNMLLNNKAALNLVRIIQEAVSNAIKHAAAQNITLSSINAAGKWQLSITDNGTGFNYHEAQKQEAGNGLKNMNQRAVESGFDFKVESGEATGTIVSVVV